MAGGMHAFSVRTNRHTTKETRMKKLATSIAAASVIATSGFAAVSANGMGDFLIAPAYYAQGSFSTELKLVNTNQTHSVIMRGVVRDSAHSKEVDFLILLSPGDVWNATISADSNGNAVLYSDDDSNYNKYTTEFAKADTLNVALTNYVGSGKFQSGYVEFYPMAAFDETAYATAGWTVALADNNTVNQAVMMFDSTLGTNCQIGYHVDKNSIAQRYESLAFGNSIHTKYTPAATVPVVDVGNWLFGDVTINSSAMNSAMNLPLLAVADASVAVSSWATTLPSLDTVAATYIDETMVESELNFVGNNYNVLFDNNGANHNVLMTFWNDHYSAGTQKRQFNIQARNYTECKMGCNTTPCSSSSSVATSSVSGCLTCGGISSAASSSTGLADPISGTKPTSSSSSVATPCSSPVACTLNVSNEFGQVAVSTMLGTTTTCSGNWDKGWVRMYNFTNTHTGGNDNLIATQMKAVYVNGAVSYNWTYVSHD